VRLEPRTGPGGAPGVCAARRVTSVCSGVFLPAAAGLVCGRRVTSHRSRAGQLAREHPEAVVGCE